MNTSAMKRYDIKRLKLKIWLSKGLWSRVHHSGGIVYTTNMYTSNRKESQQQSKRWIIFAHKTEQLIHLKC